MTALLPLVVALAAALGWSDPVPIATTSLAVPPAVAVAGGRVHVFWLDRSGPTASAGDLWHAVLSPDGRVRRPPARLRSGVDTRLAFPVAVPWAGRVAAAWMRRTPEGVALEIAVLTLDGSLRTLVRPDATPREEAGRIALATSPGALHAAWSQFDGEQRQIWYTRVQVADLAHRPPVAVAAGDAPALMLDPDPRLFWWEAAGAAGFRLMTGSLGPTHLTRRRALTGTISLVTPLPVLPTAHGGASLLLIPTLERTLSTAGRLYAVRVGSGEGLPRRVSVLGRTPVSDVSLAHHDGMAVAVWSQAVGRRQNSELFAARFLRDEEAVLDPPSRLTYTIPGSLKPAAAIVAGHPAAVWLEVTGFGEFSLSFGTSAAPRRHRFLLGITELDLYRPGGLLAFGALAAASVLPIALVLTATTLLPATLLVLVVQLIVAPFRRLDDLLRTPMVRLAAVLIVTVAIQVTARGLIPGRPTPALLAVPLACVAPPALALLARRGVSTIGWGLAAVGLVLSGTVIALFPWGAGQLSQF